MLQLLVSWSIHRCVVVVILAAVVLGAGVVAVFRSRLDVFPEFAPPQVVIQTEAPGLSPTEVEQLVTLPIEYAINGIPRLDTLRSQSIQGLSVITVIFQDGTDIYRARQQVTERLGELAGQLPPGIKAPRLAPLTSTTGRLLTVGFTARPLTAGDYLAVMAPPGPNGIAGLPWTGLGLAGRKHAPVPDAMKLRDLAQWTVRPRLLAMRGVASVTIFGGEVRQFQVRVDPVKLAARNLSFDDVIAATRQATGVRAAGYIENDRQRLNLRVEAQSRTPVELGETAIITVQGTAVRLRDIGSVVEGAEPKFGDAALAGVDGPTVALIISKQFDADTMKVTRDVEKELDGLEPLLAGEGVTYHRALFRQATFIEHSIRNVAVSLLIGAAMVAIVLFLFLHDFRIAFISLTAIPLSLLSAVLVLWLYGVGLNTLTIGGLAIAVGEVVDDAIIDVENIHRRLRGNLLLKVPRSPFAVILDASLEVRSAVVYATFIVVLVFMPVFFLSGLQGRLFAPLGYAYVLAVLASLLTALTVTPALARLLLRREQTGNGDVAHAAQPPPLLRWTQAAYDRCLRILDAGAPAVLVATVALIAGAIVMYAFCGGSFLPELKENHYVVHMRGLPGTSLSQSMASGSRVSATLMREPGVSTVLQQAGRAELGEDTWGVEYSELEVDLDPLNRDDAAHVESALHERLRDVPGYSFEVLPFLSERIKETLSGTSAQVVVKIRGDDLASVDQAAEQVRSVLASVKGSKEIRVESQTGAPELVIRPRPRDAMRFGVRNGHVLDAVHAAYQGAEIGQVYDRTRVIDLIVILDPQHRQTPEQIRDLWITAANPTGDGETNPSPAPAPKGRVQLGRVADVFLYDGRFLIAHEGGFRRQVVACNVADRDVVSFAAEVERKLDRLEKEQMLPRGVAKPKVEGEYQARREARDELALWSLVAFAGIILLLWFAFGSLRLMLMILIGVPFALVGGVAAVFTFGGTLDVGSLIGFVTLFGITMRNGIMMVSHWQHLHDVEGMQWGPELVFRGARERLAPVLMTALVTGLGLLPIAIGSGEAGREIEGPMARVILGGLVTSTALNLLVLPVLYRRVGQPSLSQPAPSGPPSGGAAFSSS
jgi:CzcA family heavy metal efflux pump